MATWRGKAVVVKPQHLLEMAKELGKRPGFVHAHHIVQKTIPKLYALVKGLNVHVTWPDFLQKAWYIGKSQEILKRYGVPLLDDINDAASRAAGGETLHNLTWALNGSGTHSTASARAVWEALSTATSRADVERALLRLSERFLRNGTLF